MREILSLMMVAVVVFLLGRLAWLIAQLDTGKQEETDEADKVALKTFSLHGELNTALREKTRKKSKIVQVCTCAKCSRARSILGSPTPKIGGKCPGKYS